MNPLAATDDEKYDKPKVSFTGGKQSSPQFGHEVTYNKTGGVMLVQKGSPTKGSPTKDKLPSYYDYKVSKSKDSTSLEMIRRSASDPNDPQGPEGGSMSSQRSSSERALSTYDNVEEGKVLSGMEKADVLATYQGALGAVLNDSPNVVKKCTMNIEEEQRPSHLNLPPGQPTGDPFSLNFEGMLEGLPPTRDSFPLNNISRSQMVTDSAGPSAAAARLSVEIDNLLGTGAKGKTPAKPPASRYNEDLSTDGPPRKVSKVDNTGFNESVLQSLSKDMKPSNVNFNSESPQLGQNSSEIPGKFSDNRDSFCEFFDSRGGVMSHSGSAVKLKIPRNAVPPEQTYKITGFIHVDLRPFLKHINWEDGECFVSPVPEFVVEVSALLLFSHLIQYFYSKTILKQSIVGYKTLFVELLSTLCRDSVATIAKIATVDTPFCPVDTNPKKNIPILPMAFLTFASKSCGPSDAVN